MSLKINYAVVATCVATLLVTGCARQISPNVYSESHVGEASLTFRGVVVSARNVQVEGKEKLDQNATGGLMGGLAGGVLGAQFGGGRGAIATTAAGAIAGAVAGSFIQKELEKQEAVEYIIELGNGEMRTVVQAPEPRLSVGQRVILSISHKGRSRVIADHTAVVR